MIDGFSGQGLREEQEDAFGYVGEVLVIADGMGGHEGGALASQAAVEAILDELGGTRADADDVQDAFAWAARRVAEATSRGGTTLVVVSIVGDEASVSWVGDSSVYVVDADEVRLVTEPHVDGSGGLTRWLPDEPGAQSEVVELDEGDLVVLCTDGVTDVLDEDALARLARSEEPARAIVDEALEEGSSDNCTVLVYRHGG